MTGPYASTASADRAFRELVTERGGAACLGASAAPPLCVDRKAGLHRVPGIQIHHSGGVAADAGVLLPGLRPPHMQPFRDTVHYSVRRADAAGVAAAQVAGSNAPATAITSPASASPVTSQPP